jgi:hypothetical protein
MDFAVSKIIEEKLEEFQIPLDISVEKEETNKETNTKLEEENQKGIERPFMLGDFLQSIEGLDL